MVKYPKSVYLLGFNCDPKLDDSHLFFLEDPLLLLDPLLDLDDFFDLVDLLPVSSSMAEMSTTLGLGGLTTAAPSLVLFVVEPVTLPASKLMALFFTTLPKSIFLLLLLFFFFSLDTLALLLPTLARSSPRRLAIFNRSLRALLEDLTEDTEALSSVRLNLDASRKERSTRESVRFDSWESRRRGGEERVRGDSSWSR